MKKSKIALFLLCILINGSLLATNFSFRHIGGGAGLSVKAVEGICSDNIGNMWFSSSNGLYRYNGADLKLYRHKAGDDDGLPDDKTTMLLCDRYGRIWICNNRYLSIYHPDIDAFSTVPQIVFPRYIDLDSEGNILVTCGSTCHIVDVDTFAILNSIELPVRITMLKSCGSSVIMGTEDFNVYEYDGMSTQILLKLGERVKAILHPQDNVYYFGTEGAGLYRYDKNDESLVHYVKGHGENDLSSNYVRCLAASHNSDIWVGTVNGLNVIDAETGRIQISKRDPADDKSLSHNSVKCIYRDKHNGMWLGTYFGGVNYWYPAFSRFNSITQTSDPGSLNDNIVNCIYEDSDGELWIGTNKGGLNKWNPADGKTAHYHLSDSPENNGSEESLDVKAIYSPDGRMIYFGVHEGGLIVLDKKTGSVHHVQGGPPNVYSICPLDDGNLLIGSFTGIDIYNIHSSTFTKAKTWNTVLYSIVRDSQNLIWAIGGISLKVFSYDGAQRLEQISPEGLSEIDKPTAVFEDSRGLMWITSSEGLYCYDRNRKSTRHYDEATGFPDKTMMGILEDNSGIMWISTINGLCRFDSYSEEVRTYTTFDGLAGNTFLANACTICKDGRLAFGGIGGLSTFYPWELTNNDYAPSPVIYGLSVFGEPVRPNDRSKILRKDISETSSITLSHHQNTITLCFSSPDYASMGSSIFEYRLSGQDEKWYRSNYGESVTYSKLPKGKYSFELRYCNGDGVWSPETKTLAIKVRPGWYESTPFIIFAVIFILTAILFAVWMIMRQKELEYKLKMEEQKHKYEEDITDIKLSLFIKDEYGHDGAEIIAERDKRLLKDAIDTVEKNMSNPDFSIDKFAVAMGMSRSNLHLRIKAITGLSALDFLHKIRFTEACRLLRQGNLTAAEVGYKIGAKSPSYFATSFKRYVGCSPLEYANRNKEISTKSKSSD